MLRFRSVSVLIGIVSALAVAVPPALALSPRSASADVTAEQAAKTA